MRPTRVKDLQEGRIWVFVCCTLQSTRLMTSPRLPAKLGICITFWCRWPQVPTRTCVGDARTNALPDTARRCLCDKQGSEMGRMSTSSKPWRANVPRAGELPRSSGAARGQAMKLLGLQGRYR